MKKPAQNKISITVVDNRPEERRGEPLSENTLVEDNVEIILYDVDGNVVEHKTIHNVLTTAAKNGLADQMLAAPTLGKPTHMAVGTGAPAANALGAEAARVALTSKTRNLNVVTCVGDFPAGTGTGALTEEGVFDAGAAGNMWASTAFGVVNKDANMAMTINHNITVN